MRQLQYLRTRLIVTHLLAALAGILLLGVLSARFIYRDAYHELEHSLDRLSTRAERLLENEIAAGGQLVQASQLHFQLQALMADRPEVQYTLYSPEGAVLFGIGENAAEITRTPELQEALISEPGKGMHMRPNAVGEHLMYYAVRIQQGYQTAGVLQLSASTLTARAHAQEGILKLVFGSVLAMLLVWLSAWVLAENIARPVQALNRTASALAQGDLSQRAPLAGPQEIQQLAAALNQMAQQTQSNIKELRAFVANASHELRTPLTVMKLRIEALRAGAMSQPQVAAQFITEIENEIDRLSRMINDLLDLSKMETDARQKSWRSVNMLEITSDMRDLFHMRAQKSDLALNLYQHGEYFDVWGNEDHLRRMLSNLIDNAIKFTYEGGQINLMALSYPEQGKVVLKVQDNGPGIPAEHLPHVFERFYRVEKTQPRSSPRRGTGLGLAIAKAIVDHHGGTIEVESALGAGATFTVSLQLIPGHKKAAAYPELPETPALTAAQRSQ
jgi:two-component system, OmpR family, sensor kinase